MKIFCSELLEKLIILLLSTRLHKTKLAKTAYISYPSRKNWTHLNGAQDLNSEILSSCKIQTYINSPPYFLQTSPIQIIHPNVDGSNMSNMRYWFKVIPHISCCIHYFQLMNRALKHKFLSKLRKWDMNHGIDDYDQWRQYWALLKTIQAKYDCRCCNDRMKRMNKWLIWINPTILPIG